MTQKASFISEPTIDPKKFVLMGNYDIFRKY